MRRICLIKQREEGRLELGQYKSSMHKKINKYLESYLVKATNIFKINKKPNSLIEI